MSAPASVATAPANTPTSAVVPMVPRPAALYVGDLKNTVTESHLYELFKQAGAVASIRVCRDSTTRNSLGYAYVNFQSAVDAERALDTLNYTKLQGRPIRVSWSQRDPSQRRSNVGNTFIKNLDPSIDSLNLEELFSSFGNIVSCKVQTSAETGESLGYGFVQFESDEIARKAIESMNGKHLNDKKIFIGPFIPRKLRQPVNSASVFTNLYVKELEPSTTEETFQELFAPYGPITSLKLDSYNDMPFGFVNYKNHDDAVRAVEEMNGKKIGEKKLYVVRAMSKAERAQHLAQRRQENRERTKDCNLYIKNLTPKVDEKMLVSVFERFGEVTSPKVMRDRDGSSRGFGFVCFAKKESAQEALKNVKQIDGKDVTVAIAQPKPERQAFLAAQMQTRRPFGGFPRAGYPPNFMGPTPMMPGSRGFAPNQFTHRPQGVAPITAVHHDLTKAIAVQHPEQAPAIATFICNAKKESIPELSLLLQNPAALAEQVKEALAILSKSSN